MARIEIKYDDRELRGVHKGFKRLQQLAKDPRPVLGDFGEALLRSTRQRFDDHKSPKGTPWTPLSTLTRQRKRNPRMLVENPQAGLKATLAWQVIGSDTVAVGSNKKYAATHQFGAIIRPKKAKALAIPTVAGVIFAKKVTIPARPFLGLSEDDEGDLRNILADYLRGILK